MRRPLGDRIKTWLEDIRASRKSDAAIQHDIAKNLGETKYRLKQKHDPFAVLNETHCGDCNRILTKGNTRFLAAIFDHGVRCEDCFALFEGNKNAK